MDGWQGRTAAELGRGIEAGRLDPRALAEDLLAAIAADPDGARVYARTTPERARAEAAAAADRSARGLRLGPLDGVPLSWKDLIDSAGVATEAGSALLRGRTPPADAAVLRAASLRGSVCLGKTHMTELAFSGLGYNPATATPPNGLRRALLPGGSSSGAGASVALGLAPAAIGSDTGGSVRLPAAWNGLVGLKTTHGLLSDAGIVPLCRQFDTIGPLCRSVEDAGLLLAALGGPKPPDLRGASLAGTRLAVLETPALADTDPAPAAAFEAALASLAAAGARLVRLSLPWLDAAMSAAGPLYVGEAWATWGALLESGPEQVYPPVLERFRLGRDLPAVAYLAAQQAMAAARARWRQEAGGFDAVLLPTSPMLPPSLAEIAADARRFTPANIRSLRNTRIGNVMGLCALTLPTGARFCGLSLMAAPFAEARLLRLGAAAERALGAPATA